MLQQVLSVALLTTMAAIPPASSQGIPQGSCVTCSTVAVIAAKVVVATPYPANSADSGNAVVIGNGMRNRLAHNIGGNDWQVVTDADMNRNLVNSGYSPDALLPPDPARTLASFLQARAFITTSLSKNTDGRYVANARFSGISDDAGQVVKATQGTGQQLGDFGSKMADQIAVVFKAYGDARACNDQMTTNKVKAVEAANKALKQVPNFGYAEYCLGLIEQQKDSTSAATLTHFRNAMIGDPLSLKAIAQVATIDQIKRDTSAVVADFQQMITIAPTNRKLADAAYKVFRQYGRPDAADQVVNQQMQLDPTSPDWPDLKGNSCAAEAAGDSDATKARTKFACAYIAFNQEYTLDPTRADSLFFQKIIFVAQNQADSMTWARRFVQKYPASVTALEAQAQLYTATGQSDSAVALVKLITQLDSTETKPMLATTVALLNAHREDAALQFAPFVKQHADDDTKNQYAGILVTFADSAGRRTPQDDSVMVHLGQAVVDLNPPDKSRVEFGHYFIVRGLQNGLTTMSKAARDDKSCDTVKKYQDLLNRLQPSLTILAASTNTGIASYGSQLLTPVQSEQKAVPQLQAAFCKP